MKIKIALLTSVFSFIIVSCSPQIKKLDMLQEQSKDRQYSEIAATQIDCDVSQSGCARQHWIKADACYRLGNSSIPETIRTREQMENWQQKTREYLDCAIENDLATINALDATQDRFVSQNQVELALLDARLRRRDLATASADADQQNKLLEEQALVVQKGVNAAPAGFYYQADALMNSVLRHPSEGDCALIAKAAELLDKAQAEGTSFQGAAEALSGAITSESAKRGCAS